MEQLLSRKSRKGQTAFEMVLISALAIIVVFSMLAYVPGISASTGKIALVKSHALEIIDRYDGFYFVADIEGPITYTDPDEITIVIGGDTIPAGMRSDLESLNAVLVTEKLYSDPAKIKIIVEQA